MEQLTGLDTSFLNMETRTTYGHVCGLAIFDPTSAKAPITLDEVKRVIRERLHLLPPFRRRLVEVPFGLDHPYWIEDPEFDLDFHVRHIGLPPPGDQQQLAELVSRIVARPLDRSRPLWELYLIEGLEGGLVGQLTKIHHCAVDGVSGAEILTTLLDLSPEPRKIGAPRRAWRPEPVPTQIEMLMRGVWGIAGAPRKGFRLARELVRNFPALAASFGFEEVPGASLINQLFGRKPDPMLSEASTPTPRTSFNDRISPHRRFAFGSVPLDAVKEIKTTFGVKVNDVILGICAGALRRYLQERHDLPRDPLIAMVPVSVRTGEQQGNFGNQVSAMTTSLHTHVEDPGQRLQAIHQSMRVAKEQHEALPASLLQDFAQFAPPAVAARGPGDRSSHGGQPRRPALQRGDFECTRTTISDLQRRHPARSHLSGGSDQRWGGTQHHCAELQRRPRLWSGRLSRTHPRPLGFDGLHPRITRRVGRSSQKSGFPRRDETRD